MEGSPRQSRAGSGWSSSVSSCWSSVSRSSSRSSRSFQWTSKLRTQSCTGFRAAGLTRYRRCRPSFRQRTRSTVRSTPRCLDTWGWGSFSRSTISPTAASPLERDRRMSRRLASAMALKASVVVAALATATSYVDIGMCQADEAAGIQAPVVPSKEGDGAAGSELSRGLGVGPGGSTCATCHDMSGESTPIVLWCHHERGGCCHPRQPRCLSGILGAIMGGTR